MTAIFRQRSRWYQGNELARLADNDPDAALVLALWRSWRLDTAEIAMRLEYPEAVIYNSLHYRREAERVSRAV